MIKLLNLCHIMQIMWFSFLPIRQAQAFDLAAVLNTCGLDIDPGGIDAAVAQNVCNS